MGLDGGAIVNIGSIVGSMPAPQAASDDARWIMGQVIVVAGGKRM